MEKYYLKLVYNSKYSAGKAREDCDIILERNGYIPIPVGTRKGIKVIANVLKFISVCTLFFRIPKDRALFIQVPAYNKLSMLIYKIVVWRTKHIQVLIHDLKSIRLLSERSQTEEDFIFHYAETIIVHTSQMQKLLVSRGVDENKIKILILFDYLTDRRNVLSHSFANTVTFAGNLRKSLFLRNLTNVSGINFMLYGLPSNIIPMGPNVKYMGKFESDNIEFINGDWGLVWDGDSCNYCSGDFGNYLKYIASHKFSLYIAAEMPVIVWNKSALKNFVEENKLGFSVGCLDEIQGKIQHISESEINEMKSSLRKFSDRIRKGKMLGDILESMN